MQRVRFGARAFAGGVLLLAVLALGGVGCQGPRAEGHRGHGRHGLSDDRTTVEMISTKIGGKNVFIPSTVVLTAGEGRSLSFFNTTDIPHGFTIPALGVETVLPSKEEFVLELPALEPGVYDLQCHLHPPHRGATLLVLP